jgi:hypothetical protein
VLPISRQAAVPTGPARLLVRQLGRSARCLTREHSPLRAPSHRRARRVTCERGFVIKPRSQNGLTPALGGSVVSTLPPRNPLLVAADRVAVGVRAAATAKRSGCDWLADRMDHLDQFVELVAVSASELNKVSRLFSIWLRKSGQMCQRGASLLVACIPGCIPHSERRGCRRLSPSRLSCAAAGDGEEPRVRFRGRPGRSSPEFQWTVRRAPR